MAYGDTTGAAAYWALMGYTGAPTNSALELATRFVDGLGWRMTAHGVPVSRFPGVPSVAGQDHEWPRTGAEDVYGNALADDQVPGAVIRATYEAAYHETQTPGILNEVVRADQAVVREKFDSIEFQYATPSGSAGITASAPIVPAIMAALAPVLTGGSNPYGITGVVA